jgi:hypothetical protein
MSFKERGDTFGYASEQLIADARLSWQANDETELSFGVDNFNKDKPGPITLFRSVPIYLS